MFEIFRAKSLIRFSPMSNWRGDIGFDSGSAEPVQAHLPTAQKWAAHVDRAALRMPVSAKCLPQAIALSRILRTIRIPHQVVIAHRKSKPTDRNDPDMLHAWLEVSGQIILGDLPGDWNEILRIPNGSCE